MARKLAMVCNEHQNGWDIHLPHVEYAYNNSVSAATGLAPNKVQRRRLPRLPLIVLDRSYGGAHQSLDRDQLAYCNLARERQQRPYELVCVQHALTVARINSRNSALSDALLRRPTYRAGGWVWIYNTVSTTPLRSRQYTNQVPSVSLVSPLYLLHEIYSFPSLPEVPWVGMRFA